MTRTSLAALAALLALVAGHAGAQDGGPQLYGRLNIGLENVHRHGAGAGDRAATWRASNYRSVLGVRGSEDLGGGWRAIFQVEGTLSPDTGAGAIAARDTRIGLQGRWAPCSAVTGPCPTTRPRRRSIPFIRPRPAT